MTHDLSILIMWVTSLGVTSWGQRWKAKAERLADTLQYMIEEEASEERGTDDDPQDSD